MPTRPSPRRAPSLTTAGKARVAAPRSPAAELHRELTRPLLASMQHGGKRENEETHRRSFLVRGALRSGLFRDPLLPAMWVELMDHPMVGELVIETVIPALGEAVAPHLEALIEPTGSWKSMRALGLLAAIRKQDALPLIERLLPPGPASKVASRKVSEEMQSAALCALGTIDPDRAEALALALYPSRSDWVNDACMEAMGRGSRPESVDHLLPFLGPDSAKGNLASDALARHRHPRTTARLIAEITPALRALRPLDDLPTTRHSRASLRAQRGAEKHEAQARRLEQILRVLGKRGSPEAVDALIDLCEHHALPEVVHAAESALGETGDRRALGVLTGRLLTHESPHDPCIRAFFDVDPGTVFERMQPYLTDAALATDLGLQVGIALFEGVSGDGYLLGDRDHPDEFEDGPDLRDHLDRLTGRYVPLGCLLDEGPRVARRLSRRAFRSDPRWADVALRLLDHESLRRSACIVLGHLRDRRALAPLLARMRAGDDSDGVDWALTAIGAPDTLAQVLAMLDRKHVGEAVYRYLGHARSPAAVDALLAKLRTLRRDSTPLFEALERSGDRRAAVPIAQALTRPGIAAEPHAALHALRGLDEPAVLPLLQRMRAASTDRWEIERLDYLIRYLERPRS